MSWLALAIATKGSWDPVRVAGELRSAGVPASTTVHVACDPRHAPAAVPPGMVVHSRATVSLFELWGLAIAGSDAPWVAVLHADALPTSGWFAAMESAVVAESSIDGYWGPIEPDFGSSDARMIGYLTEYVQFHRPLDPQMSEVPGSNLVIRRTRLSQREELQSAGFSKTRLLCEGFWTEPVQGAVALYARPLRFFDYCRRRFRHGRAFAAARTPRLPLVTALPMTAVLPLLRTARVLRHAWRHKDLRVAALAWLLAILAAESCWSAGELAGYATRRPGDASAVD